MSDEKDFTLTSIDEYREKKKASKIKKDKGFYIPNRWLCTTAGILMIISGIITFKYCTILLTFVETGTARYTFCWITFQLMVGIPSIIGGVAAILRRKYQYALAGAALSIFTTIILGVIALLLLFMSLDEFERFEE